MDALSSQATVSGYRAGLLAAEHLAKFFPMFMTAAGTVPPAKVLVMGVGVAGLQAIATARRLGAVVRAYDVRAAAKEEAESLGATFVDLGISAEGAGGYARELSPEELARQQEALAEVVAASDVVITTAAVPGRRAPVLVTDRHGPGHGPRVGRDRPGRRQRRQLRGDRARAEVVDRGDHRRRGGQPALGHADARQPPLRPQRGQPARAARAGREGRPGLGRRDRGRLLRAAGRARRWPSPPPRRSACPTSRSAGPLRPATGPPEGGEGAVTNGLLELLTIFVLAAFVGFEVISKVPSILHTPLMSGSNAIHGVILVGSMIVLGSAHTGAEEVLGFIAVILATLNVVGGFVVTDRMLHMFRSRQPATGPARPSGPRRGRRVSRGTVIDLCYLVAAIGFIVALKASELAQARPGRQPAGRAAA